MDWKKKLVPAWKHKCRESIQASKVYLVLDTQVKDYGSLFEIAQSAIGHGVDVVQLRD